MPQTQYTDPWESAEEIPALSNEEWANEHMVQSLTSELSTLLADRRYEQCVRKARTALAAVRSVGSRTGEFEVLYHRGYSYVFTARGKEALADLTGALTLLENEPNLEVSSYMGLRTFFGLTAAVLMVQEPIQSALEILDAGADFAARTGQEHYLLWLEHLRSKACEQTYEFKRGLPIAEAALAARRLNLYAPGCDLTCYVCTYASCLSGLGRHRAALRELAREERRSPHNSRIWTMRAEIELTRGKTGAAQEAIEQALLLESNDPVNHWYQAIIAGQSGDFEGAGQAMRRAQALKTESPDYSLWLAALTGDTRTLQRFARRKDWPGPLVRFLLGSETEAAVLEAAAREPQPQRCRARLAVIQGCNAEREGDVVAARRHYKTCQSQANKDSRDYEWAKARLRALKAVK